VYQDEPDCIRLRSHGSAGDAYLIVSPDRPLTAHSTLIRRLALTTLTD
jgi:hypothetical protein